MVASGWMPLIRIEGRLRFVRTSAQRDAAGGSGMPAAALLIAALVAIAVAACAFAAEAVQARTHTCTNHAGQPLGDGEYSDGAILSTKGISCAHALALVKPRYKRILRGGTANSSFRIGPYHCRYQPDGPNRLKICADGTRRFEFI
jgi:hypothetical protein